MSERTNGDLITASFNYYTAKDPPAQDEVTLLTGNSDKLGPFSVQVRNIRGYEDRFTINSHGFQILKNSSSLLSPAQPDGAVDFHDSGLIKSKYWPEITALLKESFGARVAAAMNITVRDVVTLDTGSFNPTNPRAKHSMSFAPFFVVHGDYTVEGARAHLRAVAPTFFEGLGSAPYITPEERETFFKLHSEVVAAQDAAMKEAGVDDARWDGSNYAGPRWSMFSVWRPLSKVQRHPLAIMNPRDLGPFVELHRVYRSRPGFAEEYKTSNLFVRGPKGKQHRWYYLPEQKVDEVYAIKLFDSDSQKKNGPVFGAPHSAFDIEGTNHLPARRSIECRAIVIW